MKAKRQSKILELIQKNEIETQEELLNYLLQDIRELKLTKISVSGGKQKYAVLNETSEILSEKYIRVLKDGFISMDMAQNILVIKTVSGMAGAVCASLDAMNLKEIVGSIAGDDTIMCAIRTVEDTAILKKRLHKIIGK